MLAVGAPQNDLAATIGAQDADAGGLDAPQDGRRGMAVLIAAAARDQGQARLHRRQQAAGGRGGATVMTRP